MNPKYNPAEKTAAESDYEKKFNRQTSDKNADDLKKQEGSPDAAWKKTETEKTKDAEEKKRKRIFRFGSRRTGTLRSGSAVVFIVGMIGLGVMYTSVFAPNILLVNIKEMYTNDLADATTALEIYTQIMYFNKIGPMSGQDCKDGQKMDAQSIECKLTTMSRNQKESFERQGFTVIGTKVTEDNRDDGDPRNDRSESRYKVTAIIPPNYKQTVESVAASGTSSFSSLIQGNGGASDAVMNVINTLLNPLKDASQSPQALLNGILSAAPITSGPQLWLYSQLSSTTKAQVYSVFNPRSSFFTDARYKQRIKTRYNTTKSVTLSGKTEQEVNCSFDRAVQQSDGGIDPLTGQPNATDGISLSSLSSPVNLIPPLSCLGNAGTALSSIQGIASQLTGSGLSLETVKNLTSKMPAVADLEISGNLLATDTYSYTDLMCSWYTIGKMASNALVRAKASTAARFALQYLKEADAIKAGTSDEVPANVLAGKLAQSALGGYGGSSATDSLIYRSITYGDLVPDSLGQLGKLLEDSAAIVAYNLAAYENIGTLAASWAQVIPNAAALGAVTGASGTLVPPPADIGGTDRQYCLSGETMQNKQETKGTNTQDTRCTEAVAAMASPGFQAAVSDAIEVARRTCPPVNPYDDNLIQAYLGNWRGPVSDTMLPSQKIVQLTNTPYIAGWFGINTMIISALAQQLYTSNVKGIAANYALFSGMGELLGDMAMSRGLMPSNVADMEAYLNLGEVIGGQKDQDDIARYNAKKNPLDPYNKFSFVGSLLAGLPQSVDSKAPLFATFTNMVSLIGGSIQSVSRPSSANAFYHIQPSLLTGNNTAERMGGYLLRLSSAFCPVNLEYYAIGITPDIMCNVRYSMPLDDIPTAINLSGVIDYMTKSHSDVYDSKVQELNKRVGEGDLEGNKEYLGVQLGMVNSVKNKPFIDKKTGKPTPGGEYEKYLQYCVNRLDPWGASAVYMRYNGLSNEEVVKRLSDKTADGNPVGKDDSGDPYEVTPGGIPTMAVNATQSDLDWYTGKKCTRLTDHSEMLRYFRAYTTLCSVDGSMSGIIDCTKPDRADANYSDPFYLNNDILYSSWY